MKGVRYFVDDAGDRTAVVLDLRLHRGICDAGEYFDETHNLVKLLDQVLALEPRWSKSRNELHELTTHAVEVRYPGLSADRAMASTSIATCKALHKVARKRLRLPPEPLVRQRNRRKSTSIRKRKRKS
jgi:hypothetical protein